MTPECERLVRETFTLLERRSDEAASAFYDRLFALDPSTREMFTEVDMTQQRKKFMAMLGSIVRVLDHAPRLVGDVAALGRRHSHLQTSAAHYESAGAALLYALQSTLGEACTPEVRAAWSEAYALIAAVMQRATNRPANDGHAAAGVDSPPVVPTIQAARP